MALISIIKDFHPHNYAKLLDKAAELAPPLHHSIAEPVGGFKLKERYSPEKEEIVLRSLPHLALGKGENLCLDFGTHIVGYLTLELSYTGSHPDAPAYIKLKFAENIAELSENTEEYKGWISRSWIQEEYIHVDVLPAQITLPRRYAFRYLKITMMDTSPKYKLIVRHAEVRTETSSDAKRLPEVNIADPLDRRLYETGVRTLANCMQDVFEDGPKRDRRLWMGDLRLQAAANYATFRQNDLVKRCLYLFGGSRFPGGRVAACVFTQPTVQADDTWLFDYSLFFAVALEEYLQETDDTEALSDLYDVAMQQIEMSIRMCEETPGGGLLLTKDAAKDAFIDWTDNLEKRAAAQAVIIYAIRYARRLARRKNDYSQASWLTEQQEKLRRGAMEAFWDTDKKCFVSDGQISPHSQIWMVLADVPAPEEARELMGRICGSGIGEDVLVEALDKYPLATPYMHHYYVMALLRAGLKEQAREHMRSYWGSMLDAGADTFWETWDPKDPNASPYGGAVINSYCHAWSCTPAFLITKYFNSGGKSPASTGGEFEANLTQWRETIPH